MTARASWFPRPAHRPAPASPVTASAVYAVPALPMATVPPASAPTPTWEEPADYHCHRQPWPLNETEIDLPFLENQIVEACSQRPPRPPQLHIGTVRVLRHGLTGPFDLDVVVELPDQISFGLADMTREQALRLCHLLLKALKTPKTPDQP